MEKLAGMGLVGIVLGLVLLPGCGSEDGPDARTGSGGAEIVSASNLRAAAAKETTPVFWAGERPGTRLELSQPSDDRTYVRYLTGDADAGDPRADFLTVSTYALPNAVAALRRQGSEPGGTISDGPGNATVYFNRASPQSVYLAFPGVPVEIEVYDQSPKGALRLVDSGQIVAVE